MSEQVELTDPVDHCRGSRTSFRDIPYWHVIHTACLLRICWKVIRFSLDFRTSISISIDLGIAFSEAIRLKLGITIFGQRDYESKQVSALAWGGLAVGLTFLTLSEYPELVWPLILSLSLGDPFLGEVRRKGNTARTVFITGSIFLAIIWIACWYQLGTPLWMAVFMAPLCVAAEWPRLRWIDDNATMLLIPLCAAIMVLPWL